MQPTTQTPIPRVYNLIVVKCNRNEIIKITSNLHPFNKFLHIQYEFKFNELNKCKEVLSEICCTSQCNDREKKQLLMQNKLIPFNSALLDPRTGCPFLLNNTLCSSGKMVDTEYGFKSYQCDHMLG